MNNRKSFPAISPSSWEHSADRAALSAFAAIPGASDLMRRVVGSTTERSLRLAFLGGSARVSEAQFPGVNRLVKEAASVLDLSPIPEVFVKLDIDPGAFTYGVEKPFIVLTSGAIDLWDDEELLGVIGHEMGHILSGHSVYKTLLSLILKAQSVLSDGVLGAAAFMGLTSALREWDRKSELSADRAGLLATQNSQVVYHALMKTAAGPRVTEMDINEFFRQAHDYDASSEGLDTILKFLDIVGDTHPFPALRMVALQEWEKGGGYDAVLKGDYPKRGAEKDADPLRDFEKARDSYARDFSSSQDPLSQAAGKVMDGLNSILGGLKGQTPFGPGGPFSSSTPSEGKGEARPEGEGKEGGHRQPSSVEELFEDIFKKKQ